MKVVKLGGSLSKSTELPLCLEKVNRLAGSRRVVVVPGGGAFADQVRTAQRQWRFDDRAAHCMAILAMQQMALMFQALQPGWRLVSSVDRIAGPADGGAVIVWSPQVAELDAAAVRSGWDVTSDSLAAWLAGRLSARELVLVKQANLPVSASIESLQAQGIIDRAFHRYTAAADFAIHIVNPQQL